MKQKHRALLMLALVSFLGPIGEYLVLKRLAEPWSICLIIEAILTTYAVYWWYTIDRRERNFRTGPLQNIGVVAISVLALPIYFVRSRGWVRGAVATLALLGVIIAVAALAYAGGRIGRSIAF
jgi:CDP-diglyceride synthetase